ncbi:MAG: hypothetical protein EOM21_20700 [Gammaproteobacteria bacterium]|nr:hypothetical protein [Gammaproteobacteria bacterium]
MTLHRAFEEAALSATRDQRYECDLLAALGTDAYQDDNGNFLDTAFRMVRSGDAAGQGFPVYALAIRQGIDTSALKRAMFTAWDYRDEGFSLRWDPVEDQRYALRWYDPSPQSNKKFSLRTMRGANVLALEGLSLLPVQPGRDDAQTTGFSRRARRREFFTWPIWEGPVSVDVVRSLVALPELGEASPPREKLKARGIAEVYRCERIAPSQ